MPAPGSDARLRYTYWLHYAEGSAMPPLLLKLVLDRMETGAPFLLRPVLRGAIAKVRAGFLDPQLKTHLDYMERSLDTGGIVRRGGVLRRRHRHEFSARSRHQPRRPRPVAAEAF